MKRSELIKKLNEAAPADIDPEVYRSDYENDPCDVFAVEYRPIEANQYRTPKDVDLEQRKEPVIVID